MPKEYKQLLLEFEKSLYNRQLAVYKDIIRIYNIAIKDISTTTTLFSDTNLYRNKLLRNKLTEIKRLLVSELKNKFIADIEYGKSLAIKKNEELYNAYLKGVTTSDVIKKLLKSETLKIDVRTLSNRIWKINDPFFTKIELILNSGLAQGVPAREIAKKIRLTLKKPYAMSIDEVRRLDIPVAYKEKLISQIIKYKPGRGVYKSALQNALRVARTEINIAYRRQDYLINDDLEFVKGWEVELSGQHPTFDMCDDLKGEYPKKFEFTGWHPECRCFSTPILVSKKDAIKIIKDPNYNVSGVSNIPKSAEFWVKKNVPKMKTPYYWVSDNPSFLKDLL